MSKGGRHNTMQFDKAYFAGKVAAVTGGASGIGLALCEEILESGARGVVLADFNRANLARHEARLSEQYPGKVEGILCNVTLEADVKQMLKQAAEFGGGRLDLLINCAGASLVGRFAETADNLNTNSPLLKQAATNEDWKNGFALNFFGPMYGCRHALPIMLKQGSGQIVNIISGIAFSPMAYQSMYAATKAALNALTLSLRAEYARYNIKFNSATPGTTATPMFFNAGGVLSEAQTPLQSAQRILNGVANNDRLILGDDSDLDGAEHCFLPDAYAQRLDEIYLGFARMRRSGTNTFEINKESSVDGAALQGMMELIGTDMSDPAAIEHRLLAYLKQRGADELPTGYFAEKTAAVTGGASGVGLALCEKLLRCGAKRIVLADYNRFNLDAQAARLNALYPGRVSGIVCNVADEGEVKAMIAEATDFFAGKFDLLVNCAGIGQTGMFTDMPDRAGITASAHVPVEPPERWEQIYSINFYGPLYGCRAVLPVMLRQGSGQIVNIISGTAFSGMPYQSIYASAKAALNALTLVLRYEYWDDGIKFNSSTPGTTATAIFGGAGIPSNAQTPEQSALHILTGVARNERLIFGDNDDAINAMLWGNTKAAGFLDEYLANVADSRSAGNFSDYGHRHK